MNGLFLLHSSKNILASSTSLECEEALNNGSMSAADVFVSLKTKSVLHLFARICRFLGLQVYEQGFSAVKLPKNILSGSTVLVMGFPDCGSSYFLLMQLHEDLVIVNLLESSSKLQLHTLLLGCLCQSSLLFFFSQDDGESIMMVWSCEEKTC
ncbi:hypothetical protein OROMI_001225 [Orobanche minor]